MKKSEVTGKTVGEIASQGLRDPESLSPAEIQKLAASALTQRPSKGK